MHNFFSKKNKKGDMPPPKELVILFFGALILVMLFWFLFKLASVSLAGSDDGSVGNLGRLSNEIKELMESQYDKDYKIINYFIGNDKILVGFDTDSSGEPSIDRDTMFDASGNFILIKKIKQEHFTKLYRSIKCGQSACLCMYKDGIPNENDREKIEKNVIECKWKPFSGKKVTFLNENRDTFLGVNLDGTPYPDKLFTYTYDGFTILYFYYLHKSSGVFELYIEITKEVDDKYTIYMSEINTNDECDPANRRKKDIDGVPDTCVP